MPNSLPLAKAIRPAVHAGVAGCTLGLHGDASAVPALLAPHAHQGPVVCSRWSLSWSQSRTLTYGQDSPWFLCFLGAEKEEKVNLALARRPPAGCSQKPTVVKPRGRKKDFTPFPVGTLGSQRESMHLANVCLAPIPHPGLVLGL